MSVTLRRELEKVYRVEISGRLRRRDLDAIQHAAAGEILRGGNIRLLVVLRGFEGWEEDADWRGLAFPVRHGDDVDRIAIVGDERWRGDALAFAAADARKGPVEFFPSDRAADARAWLVE